MPIYEFYCPQNHTVYSFFARRLLGTEVVPRCPDDPSFTLQRAVSGFAVIGKAQEPKAAPAGGPEDDPRMEAAFAQLEREMEGLSDENPDPRQLGHLMRRMSELSGEAIPAEMEEMVRKLEEGTDPDKLEEQYGDLLGAPEGTAEDPDGMGGGPAPAAPEGDPAGLRHAWRRLRQRTPRRDPKLYEINDYL